MTAILAIFRKELSDYFTSLTAYMVICLFLMISGGMFWLEFFSASATELTMRGFFLQAPFFLAFFAPAISMGLLSEEQRSRTLELLMTMPVTDLDIVLGKFFAALTLLLLVIGATLPYAVSLSMMGDLDWGPIVGGYLGLGLLGCTYLSLGLMISSWTRDQVVSVLVAFFLCFALSVMGNLAEHAPPWLARVLNALSTSAHFQNIARGVIDTRDIIYYLSMTVVSLGAATVTLGRRRW